MDVNLVVGALFGRATRLGDDDMSDRRQLAQLHDGAVVFSNILLNKMRQTLVNCFTNNYSDRITNELRCDTEYK